jgi:hypothetical protein
MTGRVLPALACALLASGCLGDLVKSFIPVDPQANEPGFVDAGIGYDGEVPERLTVNAAKPSHGPFVGGTEVILTGSGFDQKTTVKIGGKIPQVGDLQILSPVAIRVITPAGEVGPADVVVAKGAEFVTLQGGYTYDPIALDPDSGPTAGGTLVTLTGKGTDFRAGMTLSLGGAPLTEVEVVSPTTVRARTPAGPAGPSDLTLTGLPGAIGERTIAGAFTYYSSTNPKSGGMGGGPIAGTLTVSVLNWLDRKPVVGAQIVVQKERSFTLTAKADAKGVAVFTGPSLTGPVTVSAGFAGFESSSLVSFDARDVTIFLMPIPQPQPGPIPPGPQAGMIKGYVLFGGATGAGSPIWKIVPEPKGDQVKRVYVYTSFPSVEWGPQMPSSSATIDYDASKSITAWPYTIIGRTGGMAVYAVAGLFNKVTQAFDPYAMGIARGVVVGPGETKSVDVWVQIPLTEKITLKLKDLPPEVSRYQVRFAISLGAEGVILRPDHEVGGDGLAASLSFARLPGFGNQGLLDGSYTVDVQLESAAPDGLPTVHGTLRSVLADQDRTIVVDRFVGPPSQVKPAAGAAIEGNTLQWGVSGEPADLAVTTIRLTDDTPVWRVISKGDVTQVKLPDPKTLGLPAWPSGPMSWSQWHARLPGFSFDSYNYSHLNSSYWDRWSFDQFDLKVP